MDLFTSAIIISLIYLLVFILIDAYYEYHYGYHLGGSSMEEQYTVQYVSVFIVTCLLGIFEIDKFLCSAEH